MSAIKAGALPLLAVITVAGLLAAHVVSADAPAAMARPSVHPAPARTGWHARDVAAVTWLRELIATQTAGASVILARCEPAAGAKYIACSKPPLAQLGTSGAMNSSILNRIADQTGPPGPCDALIRSLAGSQANLAMLARDTLRGQLGGASQANARAAAATISSCGTSRTCWPTFQRCPNGSSSCPCKSPQNVSPSG